jgi:hypothetical protein
MSKGIRRPRKNHKKTTKQQDDGYDKNAQVNCSSLVATEINPTPLKPEEADNKNAKHAKGDSMLGWVKRNGWKIFEGLGIIAVIWYAVVTHVEWTDLRHNFEVDQRAWVRFRYALLKDKISETDVVNSWPLTVQNIGKSPARHTFVNAHFEIVPKTAPPTLVFSRQHTQVQVSLLFPTDDNSFPVALESSSDAPHNLSVDEIRELTSGRSYLAVFAQVTYDDQFGEHWTRFCTWKSFGINPSDRFDASGCIAWNEAGEGKPPK